MRSSTGDRAAAAPPGRARAEEHELERMNTTPHRATPGRRMLGRWRRGGGWSTALLTAPVVLAFLYFTWGPIVSGVILSFQSNNFVSEGKWVGLENFTYVLNDPLLGKALLNTFYLTALTVVFGFPLPLFLAIFVAEVRRRRPAFMVLAYLPVVVPPTAGILLWRTFYYPDSTGLFNALLSGIGLGPIGWLQDQAAAMPSLVLYSIWAGTGGTMIIFVAALTGVRTDLYEAAELDGAGVWRRVWHVTFPQIRGIILVLLLLQVIGTLQVFTEPYLFTDGGPVNSTVTVMLLIYRYAFTGGGDFGAATALSVILALILGVFSLLYYFVTRRWSQD